MIFGGETHPRSPIGILEKLPVSTKRARNKEGGHPGLVSVGRVKSKQNFENDNRNTEDAASKMLQFGA